MMFFILAVVLFGCSKQSKASVSELEKQFSTAFPLDDMNKSLQIALESKTASFTPGSEIDLIVYNKSPYSLCFDNSSRMRLLGSPDNLQWAEVKNAITYSATMILSPKGTVLLDTQYTWVRPILDQSSLNVQQTDILLRIVIVGEVMEKENRTGKKVGAYVDVVLKP